MLLTIIRSIAACLLSVAVIAAPARAQNIQSQPYSYLSTASNNSTQVGPPGSQVLKSLIVVNTTSTTYYMKLYNKASAPTCGTDTPYMRIPIPPASTGNDPLLSLDVTFPNGIGFCLTGGIADNDNSNAATGIAINLSLIQQ